MNNNKQQFTGHIEHENMVVICKLANELHISLNSALNMIIRAAIKNNIDLTGRVLIDEKGRD